MEERKIYKIDLGNTKGLSRKVDELGRYTLPMEYRKSLKINTGDEVECFLLKGGIFLKKKSGNSIDNV